MASPSSSPVQAIGAPSPTLDTLRDSPRFSSSFQDPPPSLGNSRTGLVSSLTSNGQRSYGTVKQYSSSSFRRSSSSVLTYYPAEGDTLQGLALKFNVSVSGWLSVGCPYACVGCLEPGSSIGPLIVCI